MKKLTRHSIIKINTAPFVKITLEFIPGGIPYIHLDARNLKGYDRITGFINDKDVAKFKRFAESL